MMTKQRKSWFFEWIIRLCGIFILYSVGLWLLPFFALIAVLQLLVWMVSGNTLSQYHAVIQRLMSAYGHIAAFCLWMSPTLPMPLQWQLLSLKRYLGL